MAWQNLVGISLDRLNFTPIGRKKMNECWEKPQKCMCMSNVLSKPERTSWSLTPQLDAVIIEVFSVKGLSLRGNPLRLYWAKHLTLMNWTYGDTGFYSGQTKLPMKYLYLLKMRICDSLKPLLTWIMIKIVDISDLQLWNLVYSKVRRYTVNKLGLLAATFW